MSIVQNNQQQSSTETLLSTVDVGVILRVGTDSVRRLLNHGRLPFRRIGGRLYVREQDLNAYIQGEQK